MDYYISSHICIHLELFFCQLINASAMFTLLLALSKSPLTTKKEQLTL